MRHLSNEKLEDTLEDVQWIVNQIQYLENEKGLTTKELYEIALKIQENSIRSEYNEKFAQAHVVDGVSNAPSALEKIAMELANLG